MAWIRIAPAHPVFGIVSGEIRLSQTGGAPARRHVLSSARLSTIHSVKGQEWRSVHILNAVDGCIPSDLGTGTSEAERRLLYVAMTRARDHLSLGVPLRFYVTEQMRNGDRHLYASRTRFIPREILDRFDAVHWLPPEQAAALAPRPAPIDVAARLRGMWG